MTTTRQQRIDFIQELRESYDNEQRQRIVVKRTPEQVALLLRDINDDLHGLKLAELNNDISFCNDCNQPLNPHTRVAFGVDEKHIVVTPDDNVCERCTNLRLDRLNNSIFGIP